MDLEMYSNKFSKKYYNKSYGYMCRLFDRNINNTKTYDGKKIISLNLINGNFRRCNPKLINEHRFKNNNNLNSDNGNTIMYLVRLDKLKSLEYNLDENRFITWLRLINAKSITEMEELGRNDKIMNETIEFVKHWNKAYKRESFDDFIKLKQAEAYDEAYSEAEENTKIETAKNLLSLNISISDISKATGLSKNKLLKLQKELN